jgi:hypothetical protein
MGDSRLFTSMHISIAPSKTLIICTDGVPRTDGAASAQLMIRVRERLREKRLYAGRSGEALRYEPAARVGAEGLMEKFQHGHVADACDACRPQTRAASRGVSQGTA